MIAAPAESLPDNNAIDSLLLLMVLTKKTRLRYVQKENIITFSLNLGFFCCITLGSSIGFSCYVILSSVLLAEVTVFVISSHLPPCPWHCYNIYLSSPCPGHCYNIYLSPPCPRHCYNIQLLLLSSLHWFWVDQDPYLFQFILLVDPWYLKWKHLHAKQESHQVNMLDGMYTPWYHHHPFF